MEGTFELLAPPLAHADADALAELVLDAVAGNASIGFPAGFSRGEALAFWAGVESDALAGRAMLFGSRVDGTLLGTVQLRFSSYPNGRHRAEVAKLLVHSTARRRGLGTMLMRRIEAAALEAGKTLLYLDTETDSAAEILYRRMGWNAAGSIPDFAYRPDGALRPTTFFYRALKREP